MTSAGLLVMLFSVSTVATLFGWCIWKVLTTPNETQRIHSLEFETPDVHHDD